MAVISMLAGLLLPALEEALAAARTTGCTNSIRQLGLGNSLYLDDTEGYFHPSLRGHQAWTVTLTPYLDEGTVIDGCPSENECKDGEYGYNYRYLGMESYNVGYVRDSQLRSPGQTMVFADGYGNIAGGGYSSHLVENVYPGNDRPTRVASASWERVAAWRHNKEKTVVCLADAHADVLPWDILHADLQLWDRD